MDFSRLDLTLNLYSVQDAALAASDGHRGFAFFMEQGLGKTLTSYAEFCRLVERGEATRMVVVCPNSFKSGWVSDAEKHGLDFDYFIWSAGNMPYLKTWMKKKFTKPPVLIVNWESIRAKKFKVPGTKKKIEWKSTELMDLIEEFANVKGGKALTVFDESIQAKTYDSAQTIGGMWIGEAYKWTRILSGKPIVQGPHDMWGQMKLIKQLKGKSYHPFKTAFCKMGGFKMKQVMGAQNEEILSDLIDPHVFRATKADWTDIPDKSYTMREYKMTPEMQSMYDSMEKDFLLWLAEEGDVDQVVAVDAAITKYIKLAQIQCGWIYDEDKKVHWLVEDSKNPRLNLLKDVIEIEVVGKVLIPYNHKPVYRQLIRNFGEDKSAWITGGMKPDEIEEQKRRFNEDPEVKYMFLQTRASKYGHTLLGIQETRELACATMIPYENTYSLDDRSQIEDRPHRHGQNYQMSYIDLIGTPLDKNCVAALQRKESVFQSVFAPLTKKKN